MIKLDSYYESSTSSWKILNKLSCKTKHKNNWWYTVDGVKTKDEYWSYGWVRPGDIALAPKLLSVWSK